MGDRALDRAQADHHPAFGRQLLAHHVGVASMTAEPLGQPGLLPGQRTGPFARPVGRPATRGEVALHGFAVAV